ncbi:MAG: excinuclease ABC subunit UvrB [Planctomycetes bacterium]|nr:excinuclease ABC subunit UvrB [Planctomycetota bacterium]
MSDFKLHSDFQPAGQQPQAIDQLVAGLDGGTREQVLLGVTGSGKTFVMANAIAKVNKPTLILSHNKTLTAQLFSEFRQFFPENAVEYFVSYYDYYQPEAYIPSTDVYIEKDSAVNENLDRLRLSATSALLTRRDVVVVASVSCIYGLGNPKEYAEIVLGLQVGEEVDRRAMLLNLVKMQYQRNDFDFKRGTFRVRGDSIDIWPAYQQAAIRVDMFGDEVEDLAEIEPLTGEIRGRFKQIAIFPATHFVLNEDAMAGAIVKIEEELEEQLKYLKGKNKLLEAQRLESRTKYDLEMIQEIGYCQGIENYSRHFDGRLPGERPATLFDYFPKDDWLLIVDESHVSLPQIRGMYNGDRARKMNLVDHGFRLPSALDNRPMTWDEFVGIQPQTVYVSATPAPYEVERSKGEIVELIVRPTGLVDPPIEVRPTKGQVENILKEIQARAARNERVLVTTLTKRLAEDLDEYCREHGVKTMYLHSDVHTIERVEILKDLRLGVYDALIGVNLLREGLDLPEVSLVVILDADKQGFLRSATSLIQTIGRCARNTESRVIFYGDTITDAMAKTIEETNRRREIQIQYNIDNNITPTTVVRSIETGMEEFFGQSDKKEKVYVPALDAEIGSGSSREDEIKMLEEEMMLAAEEKRFEDAAALRDRLLELNAPIKYVKESAPAYGRARRGGPKKKYTRKKSGKKGA